MATMPPNASRSRQSWPWTGIGYGDEAWLGVPILVYHADVGGDALGGRFEAFQQRLATREAFGERAVAALLEHEQVGFQARAPIPAM